jgi:rhamnose transport system permease protein
MVALCGIVLGLLYRDAGLPIAAAACGAILVGAAAGGANGGVSSYVGVPPLVVTLATMALFRGIAMGLSKGAPVKEFPSGFEWISQGNVVQVGSDSGETAYIPAPLVALLVTFLVGAVILRRSWIGRYIECIGENETAARFAAIDVRRLKLGLYTVCGAVCGCAALFQTALYATAKADTAAGLELDAIACVIVGGTRISGGHATMLGTLLGLLIIGILRYGLEMAGVRSQYIIILMGLLVVVTATLNERIGALGERA